MSPRRPRRVTRSTTSPSTSSTSPPPATTAAPSWGGSGSSWRAFVRAAFFFAVLFGLLAHAAHGVRAGEWDGRGDPEMRAWFGSLTDGKGVSCCDISDGHRLKGSEYRSTGAGWQAIVNGQWRDVPPEKVLEGVSNPTGTAVIFYNADSHIYCFVRPPEF